jgi:DNA-binding XRE family transcriptional regulator
MEKVTGQAQGAQREVEGGPQPFSVIVRSVRRALGLSQAQFAGLFLVDRNTVSRWETELLTPSLQSLLLLRGHAPSIELARRVEAAIARKRAGNIRDGVMSSSDALPMAPVSSRAVQDSIPATRLFSGKGDSR